MGDRKAIKTEQQYLDALKRLEIIVDAAPGTPEGEELQILGLLIDEF